MDARFAWTDERVEKIRALWIDGKSALQIAAALGVTRNTVVGKLQRIGCTGRAGRPKPEGLAAPAPVMPRAPRRHPTPPKPARAPAPEIEIDTRPIVEDVAIVVPMSLRVTIVDLHAAMCKWPLGDPQSDEFRYCGSEVSCGPYCSGHRRIAYQKVPLGSKQLRAQQ